MISVLMVVHEMNRGGIENFIMNLYRTVDRNTVQFDFVAHTNSKCAFDDEINELGGVIFHCPDYRVVNHFQYVSWWNDFFDKHSEYKIIHSHLDSCANIHLRIAKKHGLITIAHAHNTDEGVGIKAFVKKILKVNFNSCCDYKFGCSDAANKWLYNDESSVVLKNGIDSEKYIFDVEKRQKYINEFDVGNKTVIGSVARFSHQKNHMYMLDVFAEYNKINRDSLLLLVGDGELKDQITEKVKENNVSDSVIFAGVRSDVSSLLNLFDVFLMPSFYEGLPVSVIEAQASGLKCLLSDTISNEVDITGNVEFMSLEASPQKWAEKLASMLPYERKNMQQQIINNGYDIKSTARCLTDFYLKLSEGN